MKLTGSFIAITAIASAPNSANGMRSYLQGLPNGSAFPEALGHAGSGFTPFGKMFRGTWSASLCAQTFPGSRITVGQAFGDPCCKWTKGSKPDFAVQYTPDFPAQSTQTCPAAAPPAPAPQPQPAAPVAQPPTAPAPAAPVAQPPTAQAPAATAAQAAATPAQPPAPQPPAAAPQSTPGTAPSANGQAGASPSAQGTVTIVNTVGSSTTRFEQVGSAPATVTTTTNDADWNAFVNDLVAKVSTAMRSQRFRG